MAPAKIALLLLLAMGHGRIVERVVEAAALLAFLGLAHDQVADVDDVAQLADLARRLGAFEQFLCLLVEDVEAVPGAVEAQVGAHDADICTHDLVDLADALGDEHHLLGMARALVVPGGHIVAEAVAGHYLGGVARSCVGIYHCLYERIGGQTVAAVQTGAGALSESVEALDRRLAVAVDLDAAAEIVSGGSHGNVVFGDVDAEREALLIDVGEMLAGLLGVLVGDVEEDVVVAVELHLRVDGTGHHVAGSELQTAVILLHEALPLEVAQDAAVAAHGLGDEERGAVAGVEKRRGMELYELHVLHRTLGAVDHGDAVAGGHKGICGGLVDGTHASGGHHGDLRQKGVDLTAGGKHIGPVAGDVGSAAGDYLAQMVLGDDLYGEMVFVYVDGGIGLNRLDEAFLDLEAGVVGMMEDAELRVSPLAVEVEGAVILAVEVHAPLYQLTDLLGSSGDHLPHRLGVGKEVAGNHRVVDMLVEVVDQEVGHRRHTPLCQRRVRLFECRLADEGHTPLAGYLEGETHAGNTRTYNQIIIFPCHGITVFLCKDTTDPAPYGGHFFRKNILQAQNY